MSEQKKLINVNLTDLAGGAIQEKLDHVMEDVMENILNPNTDAKKKRKVSITLTLSPNETRNAVTLDAQVKSVLVPENGAITTVMVGQNSAGKVEANELKSDAPGQTYFDPDDGKLKDDKGEDIDQVEKEIVQTADGTVIDYQSKKNLQRKKESN